MPPSSSYAFVCAEDSRRAYTEPVTDPELAAADQRLLAALRERVERRHEGLTGPSGEGVDELEVEGLAVLIAEWTAKADSLDPAVQAEHQAIRARIDAFHAAAREGGMVL